MICCLFIKNQGVLLRPSKVHQSTPNVADCLINKVASLDLVSFHFLFFATTPTTFLPLLKKPPYLCHHSNAFIAFE